MQQQNFCANLALSVCNSCSFPNHPFALHLRSSDLLNPTRNILPSRKSIQHWWRFCWRTACNQPSIGPLPQRLPVSPLVTYGATRNPPSKSCFEGARLQPCRKRRKINGALAPGGSVLEDSDFHHGHLREHCGPCRASPTPCPPLQPSKPRSLDTTPFPHPPPVVH